jgi:hypothetical protein
MAKILRHSKPLAPDNHALGQVLNTTNRLEPVSSKGKYDIFKSDEYGNSKISNLILDQEFATLSNLIDSMVSIPKNATYSSILQSIALFMCSEDRPEQISIADAKSVYQIATDELNTLGDLEHDVILAGQSLFNIDV